MMNMDVKILFLKKNLMKKKFIDDFFFLMLKMHDTIFYIVTNVIYSYF